MSVLKDPIRAFYSICTKSGAGMRHQDKDMMNRTTDEASSESRKT